MNYKQCLTRKDDGWEIEEEITGFECCFCKKDIGENCVDPCDITIITNTGRARKGYKDECSQQFYCHIDCLRNALHKDVRGYLVIDNCLDDDANDGEVDDFLSKLFKK